MIDDQWYLQLMLKHRKIPSVTWEIHHVNAEGFCSTWFTAHDSCFCVCFQYVIQNCGSICHGGADWWAVNKREESRDRTVRREKLLTRHRSRQNCTKIKSGQTNPSVLRGSFVHMSLSTKLLFNIQHDHCPMWATVHWSMGAGDREIVSSSFWLRKLNQFGSENSPTQL